MFFRLVLSDPAIFPIFSANSFRAIPVPYKLLSQHSDMFQDRNTGFLVILEGISKVLSLAISDKNFEEALNWLLPLPFQD